MTDTVSTTPNESAPLRIEELLRPDAFKHAVVGLRAVETHISWIVLTGSLAYKIKKPVRLEFIDTSTLERRRHYCNEELRLNRRLAPDLYLDVVPITRQDDGVRVGGDGLIIDYAVCLKQFDAKDELPALLESRDVSRAEITHLAEVVARFHMQAPASTRDEAPENTRRMYDTVLDNLEQLIAHAQQTQPLTELQQLWNWTRETLRAQEATFETRERLGHIREGHGDLHTANIVRIKRRLVPFDCIDFDPQLRWIDVISDAAFLVMDLVSHGREDLSAAFLNRYLEITGDYDGVRLLPFYAIYRALVRAKVDAIAAERSPHLAGQFNERLQRRVQTAMKLMQRPRPTLLLMHGPSGSGKSWLSEQLVPALPALRIRSDLERKRLLAAADVDIADSKEARYTPEINHRVYARIVECAESCLQGGFSVIVDAAFLDAADRELLTSLADRMRIECAFLSCHADPATLRSRVASRAANGTDVSEADGAVVNAQLRGFEPLTTQTARCVIDVDTRQGGIVEVVLDAVRALRR